MTIPRTALPPWRAARGAADRHHPAVETCGLVRKIVGPRPRRCGEPRGPAAVYRCRYRARPAASVDAGREAAAIPPGPRERDGAPGMLELRRARIGTRLRLFFSNAVSVQQSQRPAIVGGRSRRRYGPDPPRGPAAHWRHRFHQGLPDRRCGAGASRQGFRLDLSRSFRTRRIHAPVSVICRYLAHDFPHGLYPIAPFAGTVDAHPARARRGVVGARGGAPARARLGTRLRCGCIWPLGRQLPTHLGAIRAQPAFGHSLYR